MRPLLACLAFTFYSTATWPCEIAAPEPHQIDETQKRVDSQGPSQVRIQNVVITRGRGHALGCSDLTSCDDLGVLSVEFSIADDDQTPADLMGYKLELSFGTLPEGMLLPGTVRAKDGVIDVAWPDGATDNQERIDFILHVTAVDLAGNAATPSEGYHVQQGGGLPTCAGGAGASLFALLGLLWFRRR